MASIQEHLDLIKNAIYGKDVRQAIHDGIQQCYYDGKAGSTDLEARQRLDSAEGSISSLGSRMSTAEGDINTLDARVDQIVAPSGEAPSVAEVTDARVGANGTTYTSLGDAVRGQVTDLKSDINEIDYGIFNLFNTGNLDAIGSGVTYTKQGKDAFQIVTTSTWKGVTFKVVVKPNTDYELSFDGVVSNGYGFFDVLDSTKTTQLITSGAAGTKVSFAFNSGNNTTIYLRFQTNNTANNSITISNVLMTTSLEFIDSTLSISGKAADAEEVGNLVYAKENQSAQTEGFMNYFGGTLSYSSGAGWHYSDYILLDEVVSIDYSDLQIYIDPTWSIAVAYIAFFDESKNLISALNGISGDVPSSQTQYLTSGSISDFPSGAKYVRFSENDSANWSFKTKKGFSASISLMGEEVEKIKSFGTPKLYGYINKINIIGDSISQGVGVEVTYDDSYAGILRKMLMVENDFKMNYGFEPFPTLAELTTVTETMVNLLGGNGFSRKWNGTDCYGSDEWSSSTAGAYITFSMNRAFNYMKVSYKNGIAGSFAVKAGNTTLLTVSVSNGTVAPALSDAINISAYPTAEQYTIEVLSGTVTISGVELGDDTSYPTFNNYGRAGIPMETVSGALLTAEADCDLLIYALGTNGTVTEEKVNAVKSVLADVDSEIIILDLCMKSNSFNNIAKSSLLKQLADDLGATYINMYELIPTDSNGYTDSSYFISDGLHPSELGHRCIAEAVSKFQKLSVQSKGLASVAFTEW